jgi:hypothetical protein
MNSPKLRDYPDAHVFWMLERFFDAAYLVRARSSAIACGGCERSRPASPRSFDEDHGRPLSAERCGAGLAIDHQSPGECAQQERGGATVRGPGRSVRRYDQTGRARDPSTSMTRSVRRVAANNSRSGTHIMTSAVLRRCTSITWRAPTRLPPSFARRALRRRGGEDRHQAVTKRLRRHWPHTRIVWRGDSHYGRAEAMEWAESSGEDYIFGLGGNTVLDARVAETADNLRFHHAARNEAKLRTHTSFMYQANSWTRPRKVVARLECSLQPDTVGEITSTGMRQEVDIRYVVTSLKGSAQHLYEAVYCQRGQMENLMQLHKASWNQIACRATARRPIRYGLFCTPPRSG